MQPDNPVIVLSSCFVFKGHLFKVQISKIVYNFSQSVMYLIWKKNELLKIDLYDDVFYSSN